MRMMRKVDIDGSSSSLNFVLGEDMIILIDHKKEKAKNTITARRLLGDVVPKVIWYNEDVIFMEFVRCPTAIKVHLEAGLNKDSTVISLARFMSSMFRLRSDGQHKQNEIMKSLVSSVSEHVDISSVLDVNWSCMPTVYTHGDLNRMNIMVESNGKIKAVIDWETSCFRMIGSDLCRHREFCDDKEQLDLFWKSFWKYSGIRNQRERDMIRVCSMIYEIVGCVKTFNNRNSVGIQNYYRGVMTDSALEVNRIAKLLT